MGGGEWERDAHRLVLPPGYGIVCTRAQSLLAFARTLRGCCFICHANDDVAGPRVIPAGSSRFVFFNRPHYLPPSSRIPPLALAAPFFYAAGIYFLRVTALRRARAYERFPELLLEHPSRAESAFRGLMLRGIAVRGVHEWQEHHMASVASMESRGGGGEDFVGGGRAGSERVLDGLGGQRCWVAEVDDSAVAIVEVTTNTTAIVP